MTFRTVELVDYATYLADPHGGGGNADTAPNDPEREDRLRKFPWSVMLKVSFAELDFANRWCWRSFGPAHGECLERYSEYRSCTIDGPHTHEGNWLSHWLGKTDYNFGYNEWYFSCQPDKEQFLSFVPEINWGEGYPK